MKRRGGPAPWAIAASSAVAFGVGFSVLLISVAEGVSQNLQAQISVAGQVIDVNRINDILVLLTVVVTGAMLCQTAAATFLLGVTSMRARREEIALRRQSGVLRSRLLGEFVGEVVSACLVGGILGEACGVAGASALKTWTVLPVEFTPLSLISAFPVTVLLALLATLWPAWRAANASPALLRRG